MKRGLFLITLFLLQFSTWAQIVVSSQIPSDESQIIDPAHWEFSAVKAGEGEYELNFKAKLDDDWTIYSMYTPAGGPLPTLLTIEKADSGIELLGKAIEGEITKKFDDIFGVDVYYFSTEYVAKQKIKLRDNTIKSVNGLIEYQVCKEGQCVSLEKDFSIALDSGTFVKTANAESGNSLIMFFWLAFIAGLAAVVMPCVFPMIPMTVSFFMHSDVDKSKARAKALFFSLSIIAIYTVLGVIISVLLGPDFVNWLSTNWIPNLFFFVIFMVFAASFFGVFDIVLPSWLVNKSDKQADRGGYIGAFFMAFTLVLVSFSCTAPIVGTVLVEAARGSVLRPIIGMLGFSLAVALPFGFFAFFPSKLGNLPQSGGWLNSVKVVLGFIEVALGLKFLMVADATYHWGLLDREVYIAIWITVFTLMGFYLMGKIRFKNDSEVNHIGILRLALIITTFSFVVYLLPGMFGAPLKALAGYLPPQETIDFDINKIVRDNAKEVIKSGNFGTKLTTTVENEECEYPKYSDFLHLPHGLEGYFDFEQARKCARAQNKPLFIDFTGHGCVNCREMEQSVWSDPKILDILKKEYVIVALYVDDKTSLLENEWYTGADGKLKKTLGKKNADFQISNFHSNAQPNYILFDSRYSGSVLTEGQLQPACAYSMDKTAFYEFLVEGVKKFNSK
ncbi:MAG: thioredoxin family protein [Culturomica sp.]|jgi:thiol:disulfide interchange protein DsbD|nr:thioredoxin family protein [Culturomica sp.]